MQKYQFKKFVNLFISFCVYGQLYHIQNLEWSDLLLKGSCDDVLKNKVMEYLINVPDIVKEVLCSTM